MLVNEEYPKTIIEIDFYETKLSERVINVAAEIEPKERDINVIRSILKREIDRDSSIVGIKYELRFEIDSELSNNSADLNRYLYITEQYFHTINGLSFEWWHIDQPIINIQLDPTPANFEQQYLVFGSNEDSKCSKQCNDLMRVRMRAIRIPGYIDHIVITGDLYDSDFYENIFTKPFTVLEYNKQREDIHRISKIKTKNDRVNGL